MRENGTLTWLLSDHLGSTSVTADANGNLVSSLRYTAFGELRATSGTTSTDYRYTGQREETEIGLYYYVARFYDPYLNHWTQPDTIVLDPYNPQDWDRYSYTRNNPVNYTDPTGHMVAPDTRENGCSGSGPACIIDMYYAESGDSEGLYDSLEAYIRRNPDYDPTQDQELTGTAPFIVAAAKTRVGMENGSFWDYVAFGAMVGFGSWATGYAPYELRTGPLAQASQQRRDMWGDPDCAGCGFQIIANPALRQSVQNTIDLIDKGGPFPYKQDGTIYLNKGPGKLPASERGYYHEYTVPMPGGATRGTVRVVVGGTGEVYLTLDHYGHFSRIR